MSSIVILKLAAMGDVAVACRAVAELINGMEAPLEIGWIIDERLKPLAQALLDHLAPARDQGSLYWLPLDSEALFQGSVSRKLAEAARMFRHVRRADPDHIVLLHRDWRYRALLRSSFAGTMTSVDRTHQPELEAYRGALRSMAVMLNLPVNLAAPHPTLSAAKAPSNRVGILVGGAQNQKVTFVEKRWPKMPELVAELLRTTDKTIALFGGPNDAEAARAILTSCPAAPGRIENFVGTLSLAELPAELARLDRFVSIDSGLAHIAAAVMTATHQKVITLFGPTDPHVWAPLANGAGRAEVLYKQKSCSPCYRDTGRFDPCPYKGAQFQHCMTDIGVADVLSSLG